MGTSWQWGQLGRNQQHKVALLMGLLQPNPATQALLAAPDRHLGLVNCTIHLWFGFGCALLLHYQSGVSC
jgi:hypothetical protein